MTGFEPRSSGVVSDRSANCATTTSQGTAILTFMLECGIQSLTNFSKKNYFVFSIF